MNKLKLKELNNLTHSLEKQRLSLEESYYPLLISYFNLSSLSELEYLLSIICPTFCSYRMVGAMRTFQNEAKNKKMHKDMVNNTVSLEEREILRTSFNLLVKSKLRARISNLLSPYKETIEKSKELPFYKRHLKHCISAVHDNVKAHALFHYLMKYPHIFFSFDLDQTLIVTPIMENDPLETFPVDINRGYKNQKIRKYFSYYPELSSQLSSLWDQWRNNGIKLRSYSNPHYLYVEASS